MLGRENSECTATVKHSRVAAQKNVYVSRKPSKTFLETIMMLYIPYNYLGSQKRHGAHEISIVKKGTCPHKRVHVIHLHSSGHKSST